MEAVTHLEKVIVGEASAVTHLEKVIAGETSAVTYTEKVITGEATPITHLQKVIAGEASPVTHLEYVWAGSSPEPTEHEYTGAVPVTINADGEPLLDFLISGNMQQTGTPTPTTPIQPSECGERTGNLFDESTIEVGGLDINTGAEVVNSSRRRSGFIKVTPSTAYTLARVIEATKSNLWIIGYDANKNVISDGPTASRPTAIASIGENTAANSFDTTPLTEYIRWYVTANGSYSNLMFNIGSTSLPYEPYGYKLDISSASTTTPVYLGEVQTTRKIKKYEFTGEENWIRESGNTYALEGAEQMAIGYANALCTHYVLATTYNTLIGTDGTFSVSRRPALFIHDENFTSAEQLKTYLATQYANGTPVTVWYVLATETTGIVNEPLRKIGDYADTLSMEQAGVSIPTNNGSTTVDVETTLKPSEVYIKYKGV